MMACVVAAVLGVACGAHPLDVGAIRDCITPDTGIAVPVDSALYAAAARACLARVVR